MTRVLLRGDQWERIKEHLPGKASDCGVTAADNRLFFEAVLWIARTGSPWRDLPACFGHWHRVYVRYHRSCPKGTWAKLLAAASDDPDLEYLMVTAASFAFIHTARQKNSGGKKRWASPAAA